MKAYLAATGSLFALMAALHAWRAVAEWPPEHPAHYSVVVAIGVLAALLSVWAWRLFSRHAARDVASRPGS
ncbi:MAG TPA: hypothetical protein VFB67_13745 [Candidatus Polarisedimenticolaceae bacterium]|nr:hypothetical protein [Candidatus Polarisedimenticolaceae bacterium]